MGIYTLGTKFRVTLHTILCGNYGFRGICILVVVLHVAQNIMQCGSLWRSANSLLYSLGLFNFETVKSDGHIGSQDNLNLQPDGICTDICSQFPRNSEALELYVVTFPMKL
jgi:hypothetical protein